MRLVVLLAERGIRVVRVLDHALMHPFIFFLQNVDAVVIDFALLVEDAGVGLIVTTSSKAGGVEGKLLISRMLVDEGSQLLGMGEYLAGLFVIGVLVMVDRDVLVPCTEVGV